MAIPSGGENPGTRVGPWLLHDLLGEGGNARVWRATRDGHESPVALKVLKARPISERYGRFRNEATALRECDDVPGILPLVDAHLPERPERGDPPWIAMPIATPIEDTLQGQGLRVIVSSLAAIAATLAELAKRSIYHRDIKPANLYSHDGRPVVGDFGLVSMPDLSEWTMEGRALGPLNFMAPELLILGAGSVRWEACDVFSVAKTLWALAAEVSRPPPGSHDVAGPYSLANLRPYSEVEELDRLIAKATSQRVEVRPGMAGLHRELLAWLRLSEESASTLPDLSRHIEAIRGELQADHDERERKIAMGAELERAKGLIQTRLAPIRTALRSAFGHSFFESLGDIAVSDWLATPTDEIGRPEVWGVYPMSLQGRAQRQDGETVVVRVAALLELLEPGDLRLATGLETGVFEILGGTTTLVSEEGWAQAGSTEIRLLVEEHVSRLELALPNALVEFERLLRDA